MKKKYFVYFVFSLLIPLYQASAHVKWFVDSEEVIKKLHGVTPFYYFTNREVLIWSLISLVVVLTFSFLDRVIQAPKKLAAFGIQHARVIQRISQIILGLFLVSISFLWKIIIIPDIHINNSITMILGVLQTIIGLMYISNIFPRIASVVLIGFCFGIGFYNGFETFAENAILLSLAIYFFIKNSPRDSMIFKLDKHSVEFVRIGTGVSLIVLAFTEKLAYPELSLSFLSVHHWNFMQSLLPWFTNNLFVLSVGFSEMIFGILFIMGYITRITTILIAIFFGISVTTMLLHFGAWEVEDLVVYSAAILFIFYGHGETKFFHFTWPVLFKR